MSRKSYNYNYGRKKKGSLKIAALVITTVLLASTALLVVSPSFRDMLASVTERGQMEQTVETTEDADTSEWSGGDSEPETTTSQTVTETTAAETEPFKETEIELIATGDVLLHMPVINGVKRNVEGETVYQFDPVFRYIKDIISTADYSVFNFEGTLAGPPYSGYPMFSAPDSIVPTLADTGFDLASTVNNHSIDRGFDGFLRTLEVFAENEMPTIGTKASVEDKSYQITDIDGIKVGFSSFSYETVGTEEVRALNGLEIPEAAEPLIDSFNPYRADVFAQDVQDIIERVETMSAEGAEFICMVMHWGDEYNISSNSYQQYMAQRMADAGVDLIIGHHPHVVQEIDFVQAADSEHEMLVYYSLGNFISNQYFDTGNAAGRGQDGMVARVKIKKTEDDVFISSAEYIPIHVVRVTADGIPSHRVVPVLDALEDPQSFETTKDLMQASLARTEAVMAANGSSENIELLAAGY